MSLCDGGVSCAAMVSHKEFAEVDVDTARGQEQSEQFRDEPFPPAIGDQEGGFIGSQSVIG